LGNGSGDVGIPGDQKRGKEALRIRRKCYIVPVARGGAGAAGKGFKYLAVQLPPGSPGEENQALLFDGIGEAGIFRLEDNDLMNFRGLHVFRRLGGGQQKPAADEVI
jgi:hypothetical protein